MGPKIPPWASDLFIAIQELKGAWPEILGATVGSFLGLAALVVGALYNAKLNRRAEREKEMNDKFGIVEALLAEIALVKGALERGATELEKGVAEGVTAFMPDPAPPGGIFAKFLERIELFDEVTVSEVAELYTMFEQYCGQLVVVGARFDQSIKGRGTLVINGVAAPNVALLNRSLCRRCSNTITHLRTLRLFNAHRISRG